ncbi:hypothetical protein SCHPADRAFT_905300 [Schizopora paradoxa]|uniref:Cupredoxin n=1 Tax=Schizopora paradoxa TaxID=27342 RepID=A0A0H2RKX1_9AGAM|nr:hypothetical protein SCHPADRAFT_905300 [Schizopora paradoxa]
MLGSGFPLLLLAGGLTLLANNVRSQNVIQVKVGDEGLFFVPPTVNASVGDIVSFSFVGKNHSVTQSSQDNPCTPLDGGFNSGLLGIGNDTNAPPGIWNLTITDDSQPIWYFCEAVSPESHCTSGMVGAINPPSNDSYNAFQSSAKEVTETISPTIPVALTGVGAAASIFPTTTATEPPSTGSSSSSGTGSTNAPSPTTTTSDGTSIHHLYTASLACGWIISSLAFVW